MRAMQRLGDLRAVAEHVGERQRSPRDAVGERLSFEQLHDEEVVADVEEGADVRVRELRDRLRLSLEANLQLHIRSEVIRENLDRDLAIEARVAPLPDLAHTSGPETRDDLIRTEACTLANRRHDDVGLCVDSCAA